MNKNKIVKKPVESKSFKNKMLGVLGLRNDEDTHNIDRTMQSVAASIARLTELVESIDERVLQLDSRVSHLEVHISARITKSEQNITDSWDDTAQEIYMHNENQNIQHAKWYEGWNKKIDKLLKKIVEPVLSSDVSVGPTAPPVPSPSQTFGAMEGNIVALTEAVEKLSGVVKKLDTRLGKVEKSVAELAEEQVKFSRKMKNY